jgi:hypothetical protein
MIKCALRPTDLRDISMDRSLSAPMKDVFALQSQITQAVAARLKPVSPNETVALNEPPTADFAPMTLPSRSRSTGW